jgi:hypothetical protein
MFRAPYAASCMESDAVRSGVIEPLKRVPLRPSRWPGDPRELFVGPALIAVVSQNERDWDIFIGAKSRQALGYLRNIEASWDVFDG